MRLRAYCAVAGGLAALPFGVAVGIYVAGVAAVLAWALLCCDANWLDPVEVLVLVIGFAVGGATIGAGALLGFRIGRANEGSAREGELRLAASVIAGLAVVAAFGLGYLVESPVRGLPVAEVGETDTRSPALKKLEAERHKLIHLQATGGDTVRMTFISEGARAGSHRIRMQVSDQIYRRVLASADEVQEFPAGQREDEWDVKMETLGQAYNQRVLNNRPGDVQLDEPWVVNLTIEPVLTPEELAALAESERQRLASGALDLSSRMRATFQARLYITR